jgi:hypothetical protein
VELAKGSIPDSALNSYFGGIDYYKSEVGLDETLANQCMPTVLEVGLPDLNKKELRDL